MRKNRIVIWILSAVAVALLAAVIVLTCLLVQKHQQEESKLYYDSKCAAYAVQNQNLAKGQIVFIGDSITDLYILDDHYGDLPLAVYNRGISGDYTDGVLARLQVSVFDLAPSKVVLMIGTNDVNWGVSNDVILQRYEQIVDSIFATLPEVELYCMSIIPQNKQIETYSSIRVEKTTQVIRQLNPQIKALAEEKGAIYLDLFSHLADENHHLIEAYSDDGLHLNVAGLEVWTGLLKPYLQGE